MEGGTEREAGVGRERRSEARSDASSYLCLANNGLAIRYISSRKFGSETIMASPVLLRKA